VHFDAIKASVLGTLSGGAIVGDHGCNVLDSESARNFVRLLRRKRSR
jgi:hypothetical protein